MQHEDAIMKRNPVTGDYEGYFKVTIEADIFRRSLNRELELDASGDMTDLATYQRALAKIGKATYWRDHPHAITAAVPPPQQEAPPPPPPAALLPGGPMMSSLLEEDAALFDLVYQKIREKKHGIALSGEILARILPRIHTSPPYLWEETLVSPIPEEGNANTKQALYRRRHLENFIVSELKALWKEGSITLTDEAKRSQAEHETAAAGRVTQKIEVVAAAVNGARIK
jgi:hypothetical protein